MELIPDSLISKISQTKELLVELNEIVEELNSLGVEIEIKVNPKELLESFVD